jgi:hypothetical protein
MRSSIVALLAVATILMTAGQAQAKKKDYPPRYTRGSYAEKLVIRRPNGQVDVRTVWSGYSNGWPRPAWLYYGYPHSGDDTGIGPMDRR